MAVTSSPTKDQITNQVDQIQPDGNYTANELRGLLSNIVGSLYSPFYSATSNPSTSNNQTQNYKTGSLGKNSSTGRYFVCSSATASTATWEQITNDKGYQAIGAQPSQVYQVSSNASIVSFSGSQNSVTIYLPTAANSYQGKVVRIYFSSPAQSSGLGVTFAVPELSPVTLLAANVYTSHAFVEFTFVGTTWVLTQYVPTVSDFGFQGLFVTEAGTGAILSDTYLVNLTALSPTAYTAYNVTLPAEPYLGKVVKIQASTNVTSIGTLTVKRSDGTTLTSGAISANQGVEFLYNGSAWTKVAPTIIWP
jgi:hypothetical protein